MSVIVLGMEMPESCYTCKLGRLWDDGSHDCRISKGLWMEDYPYTKDVRHAECPLRPLPEKHGRLVDVSPLNFVSYNSRWHSDNSFDDGVTFILEMLDNLPTIIEAEGKYE